MDKFNFSNERLFWDAEKELMKKLGYKTYHKIYSTFPSVIDVMPTSEGIAMLHHVYFTK